MIISSFIDTDLYTFTVAYLYLQKFPRTIVTYKFNDRNLLSYSEDFLLELKEEISSMRGVKFTSDDEKFMKSKCYYLPNWFYTFLKGYEYDPNEVCVLLDENNHLNVSITGYAWRTVMWEVPLLAIISELYHKYNGDFIKFNKENNLLKAKKKCQELVKNGLVFSDFGTRRRFSFECHVDVVKAFKDEYNIQNSENGRFVGTSNVFLAKEFNLIPVGTMSHQVVSMCGALFGYREANFIAMDNWQEVFNSDLGIFLYDTYGWDAFQKNFSKKHALLFSGLRVDSGNNFEMVDKIISKYESLGIDPSIKQVTFSNGLNTNEAIEIHKYVNGRVKDNYGIGTHFTCDIDGVKPMNIVIKLYEAQMTEKTEVRKCVKLSDDFGKTSGDANEVDICLKTLKIF